MCNCQHRRDANNGEFYNVLPITHFSVLEGLVKNLKLDAVEHHWCSTISTKLDLVPRGHLFPPPLSTSCKLSNNTSFTIRQMHNCRGCTCNQVFLVKNSQSLLTSKHIQHSSCPESGLHLCFPSTRLSRHTLQTSQ